MDNPVKKVDNRGTVPGGIELRLRSICLHLVDEVEPKMKFRPRMFARCPRIMAPRAPIGWGVERPADGAARPNPCASSPAQVNRILPPEFVEGLFSEIRMRLCE